MKQFYTIIALLLLSTPLLASESLIVKDFTKVLQDDNDEPVLTISNEEPETLFGDGPVAHGGWGGIEVKHSRMRGEDVMFVGARGGWIIDHRLTIGAGGYGMVMRPEIKELNYKDELGNEIHTMMNMGYGGIHIQFGLWPLKSIHIVTHCLIGAGGIIYTHEKNSPFNNYDDYDEDDDEPEMSPFFVVEPGIGLELNMFKFMRIEAGASYRYIRGSDISFTTDKDLQGVSATVSFKFGSF